MNIRRAVKEDIEGINKLLFQVLAVHHKGRPDIFKPDVKKYTDKQLKGILKDDLAPVFVAENEEGDILGYAFCVFQIHKDDNILTDITTLYIDDLCVDENARGQKIGKKLYEHALEYARNHECYNVTLNVWACNEGAIKFYEKCGMKPQKIGMEIIL